MTFMFLCAGVVLPEYTRVRVPDDHAIADLAMYNYVEVINVPTMVNRARAFVCDDWRSLRGGSLVNSPLFARCELTSTPGGSSSGSSLITSCMPSCQRQSFLSIQWFVPSHRGYSSVVPSDCMSQGHFYPSQVTFTRTPYHEAVERWHWQNKVKRHARISH